MENINTCTLVGNLTRDAELSYTGSGTAVLKYSIAVNRSVKSGDSYKDEPSFIEIVHYGKAGESIKKWMTKGSKVCVTGSLRQDRWQSEGQTKSKIYVVANQIEFMSRSSNDKSDSPGYYAAPADDEIPFNY